MPAFTLARLQPAGMATLRQAEWRLDSGKPDPWPAAQRAASFDSGASSKGVYWYRDRSTWVLTAADPATW